MIRFFEILNWDDAVTSTTKSCEALKMLKENPKNFDIVITDVKMPEMDGFALLEIVGLEMDIPVICKETFLFLLFFIFL